MRNFRTTGDDGTFEALAHLIASRPVKLPEDSVTEAAWEYDMDIKSVQSHETQSRPINEYRDESGRLAVTDWQLLAQDGSYVPAGTEPPRKDFGTDLKLPSQVPSRPLKVNYGLTAQQAKRLGRRSGTRPCGKRCGRARSSTRRRCSPRSSTSACACARFRLYDRAAPEAAEPREHRLLRAERVVLRFFLSRRRRHQCAKSPRPRAFC